MSIEGLISDNTLALNRLTDLISELVHLHKSKDLCTSCNDVAPVIEIIEKEPAVFEMKTDYEDVKARIVKLAKNHREKVVEILNSHGLKRLPDLLNVDGVVTDNEKLNAINTSLLTLE